VIDNTLDGGDLEGEKCYLFSSCMTNKLLFDVFFVKYWCSVNILSVKCI